LLDKIPEEKRFILALGFGGFSSSSLASL
jgi:hypothetical protein